MRDKERKVYLPLERLDKCAVCGASNNFRLCSRCGEVRSRFASVLRQLKVDRPYSAYTAVNNARARLVVLLLGTPEVLEGAEGSQDGSTDPDGVLSLRRSNDLDLKWKGVMCQHSYHGVGSSHQQTFMLEGERASSSFCIRSEIPGNIVVPPERTTFPYRSRRISRSHLKIEL